MSRVIEYKTGLAHLKTHYEYKTLETANWQDTRGTFRNNIVVPRIVSPRIRMLQGVFPIQTSKVRIRGSSDESVKYLLVLNMKNKTVYLIPNVFSSKTQRFDLNKCDWVNRHDNTKIYEYPTVRRMIQHEFIEQLKQNCHYMPSVTNPLQGFIDMNDGTRTMVQIRIIHSTRKRRFGIKFVTSDTLPTIVYVANTKFAYVEPSSTEKKMVYRTTNEMILFTI
jgi:hypothetical protein